MITFEKKAEPAATPDDTEKNRFERIRKAAAEMHRRADIDGTRRRSRRTADDNRPV
jgi:hypothetical protein